MLRIAAHSSYGLFKACMYYGNCFKSNYRYSCSYNFAEAYHLELNLKRDDALDELKAHLLLECSEVLRKGPLRRGASRGVGSVRGRVKGV